MHSNGFTMALPYTEASSFAPAFLPTPPNHLQVLPAGLFTSFLLSHHMHTYTYIPHMRGNVIFIFPFSHSISLSCSLLFPPFRYHPYSGSRVLEWTSLFKRQAGWKLVQVWWLAHDAHVWFKPRFLCVKFRSSIISQPESLIATEPWDRADPVWGSGTPWLTPLSSGSHCEGWAISS